MRGQRRRWCARRSASATSRGLRHQVTGALLAIPRKPENSTCNDGNACTATDTCQAGACVGAAPVTCTADQCHDMGVCNSATGAAQADKAERRAVQRRQPVHERGRLPGRRLHADQPNSCAAPRSAVTPLACATPPPAVAPIRQSQRAPCSDGQPARLRTTAPTARVVARNVTCNDGVACTADSCSEQQGGCTTTSTGCACKTSADCNAQQRCAVYRPATDKVAVPSWHDRRLLGAERRLSRRFV